MNTAFTRLIWKEHRAQRSLWLTLLLGCVGLFILMRLQASPWLESLLKASSFCILFVVASTAIAFAGEVDDRAVTLLRMLPCRTSTLMMAKLTAILTGCGALFLALAALSGILEIIGLAFPAIWRTDAYHLSFSKGELMGFSAGIAIFSFFTFACTVVASMVSKRVVSAVGLAAAISLGMWLYGLPFLAVAAFFEAVYGQDVTAGGAWVCLCLSLAVAALSRPWHLGRIPREWRISLASTNRSTSRISLMMPRTIAVLKRVIAWPMSQSRVRATLFWRECWSAIPFAALWLLIGIVICVGRYAAYRHAYFWPVLLLFVFMHECGQRTMRADQRSGSISLLANMGVSPASIWFTKTVAWLGVLTFVGTLLVLLDAFIPSAGGENTKYGQELRGLQIISYIRAPHVADSSAVTRNATLADHSLQISTCVA